MTYFQENSHTHIEIENSVTDDAEEMDLTGINLEVFKMILVNVNRN